MTLLNTSCSFSIRNNHHLIFILLFLFLFACSSPEHFEEYKQISEQEKEYVKREPTKKQYFDHTGPPYSTLTWSESLNARVKKEPNPEKYIEQIREYYALPVSDPKFDIDSFLIDVALYPDLLLSLDRENNRFIRLNSNDVVKGSYLTPGYDYYSVSFDCDSNVETPKLLKRENNIRAYYKLPERGYMNEIDKIVFQLSRCKNWQYNVFLSRPYSKKIQLGIVFGTGWNNQNMHIKIEELKKEGKWRNPFSKKPFPKETKYISFGELNSFHESIRVMGNHFGINDESKLFKPIQGNNFKYVICHSNGCTVAIQAYINQYIKVDHFLMMGSDWTHKRLDFKNVSVPKITVFTVPGDPVPFIPHLFGKPDEDGGRIGLEISSYVEADNVVSLPELDDDTINPIDRHDLGRSYFPRIEKWIAEGE